MKPTPTSNALPVAHAWLSAYEACARVHNYAQAKALFHERTICFGIDTDLTVDVDDMTANEWKQVWPNQVSFTFDLGKCSIVPDGNMIAIAVPWTAQSKIAGAPPKHGRATVVLCTFSNVKTKCVHLHMSANAKVAIV